MKTRVRIQLVAPGEPGPTVELPNGSVATQGTSLRKWIERNEEAIAERPDP